MKEEESPKPGLPERLIMAAAGIGEGIVRTTQSAASLIVDRDLRRRSSQVVSNSIQSGANTIGKGLKNVQQGPRYLQTVLHRLSHQIEEQRMHILLEEQRDTPVDVQVGFQLYEDAPQELRSRLWMVLLERPSLVERFRKEMHRGYQANKEEQTNLFNNDDLVPSSRQSQETQALHAQQNHENPSEEKTEEEEEEWEVVPGRGRLQWRQGGHLLSGGAFHRIEPWNATKESLRQDIMSAMISLPWPIPSHDDPGDNNKNENNNNNNENTTHTNDGRYATLLQISIGQEDIDDVIQRDVHRTFPEYPFFGFDQGQQALFRVLKAYSLHDLEVGYCQGMAFVAGLILFYVPEEPAFRILCRLMSMQGPNLRRYYMPGLRGLKIELRKFDWLLQKHLPRLKNHLETHGAVPVLFASQWFLSAFSNPFPVSFASRLVDVMLNENSDAVLMRVALAVMAESEAELLMQDDFEELLTYLKVEPMVWSNYRLRKVLNASVNSPLSYEDLEEAEIHAMGDEPSWGGLPLDSIHDDDDDIHGSDIHGSDIHGGDIHGSDIHGGDKNGGDKNGGDKNGGDKNGGDNNVIAGKNSNNIEGAILPDNNNNKSNDCCDNIHKESDSQHHKHKNIKNGDGDDINIEDALQQHEHALDSAYIEMIMDLDKFWSAGDSLHENGENKDVL